MTLQDLALAIRRSWIWVAVLTVLGIALGVGALFVLPKTYSATATNFVQVVIGSNSSAWDSSNFVDARVPSYPVLVKSPDVLSEVAKDLDRDPETSYRSLARSISATNPADSSIIEVTATSPTPAEAAAMANSAAEHLAEKISTTENGSARIVAVSVVVPAVTPDSPTFPSPILTIPVGMLLGLVLGTLIAMRNFAVADSKNNVERNLERQEKRAPLSPEDRGFTPPRPARPAEADVPLRR